MKKIGILALIFILAAYFVFAAGNGSSSVQGIHEPGTGIENPEIKEAGQGTGQGLQSNIENQTQNQGEETRLQNQIRTQIRVQSGNYTNENGQQMQIQEQSNNRLQLRVGNVSANCLLNLTQEQVQERTRLKTNLSNGKGAEIKIMPDTASKRAIERLKLKVCNLDNNCSIELKEVGTGQQIRAAYEIQAQKEAKILGMFKTKMQVKAQVDAENGEIIRTQKPWWAFMATESAE